MRNRRALATVPLLVSLIMFCHGAIAATTVVTALLQDPSSDASNPSMHIALDQSTVPAGKITFRAVNQSRDQVHELIVVRTAPGQAALPYDDKRAVVVEKRIHHLGEIPDLKPGASGAMTLNLKPGSYVLICNRPGHYKAGMSAALSVN